MEELNLRAKELCFNIDTIKILRKQNKTDGEIKYILKKEIKYSNELIHSLLNLTKEFINTLLCGIKYRLNDYTKDELKYILINDNENLTPLIEYLFGDNMKYYDEESDEYIKNINNLMYKSINGTKNDVGNVIYELSKNKFVCASIKNKIWYEYKNHKWEYIEDAYSFDQYIGLDVVSKYESFMDGLRINTNNDEEYMNRLIDLTNNVILKLKTKRDRTELINICSNIFYDSNFFYNLDENNSLLCFNNGIYDLNQKIFRNGDPNDYISYSLRLNYIPYDDFKMDVKKQLDNFLISIFPNDNMREYSLTYLAISLYGKYFDRKYNIWCGNSETGLMSFINLIKQTFNDYLYVMNNEILSGKKSIIHKIENELSKTKGKRLCIISEIEDYLNKSSTKMINHIMSDKLIKSKNLCVEFTPQFNIILPCASMPNIKNIKDNIFNHIHVLKIDDKCDKSLNITKELCECFISLLIDKFNNYNNNHLIIPSEINEYTISHNDNILEEYNNDNNMNKDNIDELYKNFILWYNNKYGNKNMPSMNDIKKYIDQIK